MSGDRVDPAFPNRPQSEDFWLLSRIAVEADKSAETLGGDGFMQWVESVVDLKSLQYMAQQRALRSVEASVKTQVPDERMMSSNTATFMDGFLLGVRFALAKTAPEGGDA